MPTLPIRQASGELRTVAEMWRVYVERVLPRNASQVQVQECRRAFYAGVQSVLVDGLMGIGDDAISEEQGLAHLTALHDECQAFVKAILAGRA